MHPGIMASARVRHHFIPRYGIAGLGSHELSKFNSRLSSRFTIRFSNFVIGSYFAGYFRGRVESYFGGCITSRSWREGFVMAIGPKMFWAP